MVKTLLAPENDYSELSGREVDSPTRRVAVVIPVYNRAPLLRRTLAGIQNQTYPPQLMSVVVADDGSDEDITRAVELIAGTIPVTIVRRDHEGYGAGQARNLGALEASGSDLLMFFDADCIPDPAAVERHAAWHHLADNLVVIGSRHHVDTSSLEPDRIAADESVLRELAFGSKDHDSIDWTSEDFRRVLHRRTSSLRYGDQAFRSLVSSNFSVSRDQFLRVGGFSADFSRWGGEDTELGWRLWNDGLFFVDEPRAAIYHQLQEDEGSEGWRDDSRRANDGLIQSKVPHRHYRHPVDAINESAKVSVVVHHVVPERIEELIGQLTTQRLEDLEVVLVGDGIELVEFVERRQADPRFALARTVEEGITDATGEFVALVHGAAAFDHRLMSRSVAAIERKPRLGRVRSAYGVLTTDGVEIHRRAQDTTTLDRAWSGGLPIFGMTRKRDLMKVLRDGKSAADAWGWIVASLEEDAHGTPLVLLPAREPSADVAVSIQPMRSLKSMVASDVKSGGRRAVSAPIRAARSKLTGSSYQLTSTTPKGSARIESENTPIVRYVGWTGHSNLGDEAMLDAVTGLFEWADVRTGGDAVDLLMLGGGTLINRGFLRQVLRHDSPSVERVAFGTGVANPDYWGQPKEKPGDWIAFLESCLTVGVRGPISAELLVDWGLSKEPEIIGDPALSLRPGDSVEAVDGRVVICPAFTKGLLFGGDDENVFSAFADLSRHLLAADHDVVVLSASPRDDRHIIEMMRDAGAADLPYIAAHDDPQAALDLLATADLMVAERLHGAVLAAASGTPSVLVEYRPKLRDFAQSVGLEQTTIRTDSLKRGALLELTEATLDRKDSISAEMMLRVSALRRRQSETARLIKQAIT